MEQGRITVLELMEEFLLTRMTIHSALLRHNVPVLGKYKDLNHHHHNLYDATLAKKALTTLKNNDLLVSTYAIGKDLKADPTTVRRIAINSGIKVIKVDNSYKVNPEDAEKLKQIVLFSRASIAASKKPSTVSIYGISRKYSMTYAAVSKKIRRYGIQSVDEIGKRGAKGFAVLYNEQEIDNVFASTEEVQRVRAGQLIDMYCITFDDLRKYADRVGVPLICNGRARYLSVNDFEKLKMYLHNLDVPRCPKRDKTFVQFESLMAYFDVGYADIIDTLRVCGYTWINEANRRFLSKEAQNTLYAVFKEDGLWLEGGKKRKVDRDEILLPRL